LRRFEVSLTLGGAGEVVRGEGRGGGVDATLLSYTLKYISLPDVGIIVYNMTAFKTQMSGSIKERESKDVDPSKLKL
jgi:hypothetical protein